MSKLESYYNKLLIFVIFFQIVVNSSNSTLQSMNFNKIQYFLWSIMFFSFFFQFYKKGMAKNVFIRLCIFSIFTIFFALIKDYIIVQLFVFVIYCIYLNKEDIIKDFLLGMIGAVILIVIFSFIGIFPMYNDNYLLSFGFNNPNTLGLIITLIYLSSYYVAKNMKEVIFLLFTLSVISFAFFSLNDDTACIVVVLFYVVTHIKVTEFSFFLKKITAVLPFILLIFSIFLSYSVEKYNWTLTLSNWLTKRPEIWNQYYSIYSVHLLPQNISNFVLSKFEKNFLGNSNNLPLIYRGFDGSYSHDLLLQGIIITLISLASISYFVLCLDELKDKNLIYMYFVFLIFAFTESVIIVPFGSFQNYFLILSIRNLLCYSNKKGNGVILNGK